MPEGADDVHFFQILTFGAFSNLTFGALPWKLSISLPQWPIRGTDDRTVHSVSPAELWGYNPV